MKMTKRDCNIQMTLSRDKYCGQRGKLIVNGQEFEFATTDGLGQFFGHLIGIMCSFLGCTGYYDQKFFDKKAGKDDPDDGHHRLHGSVFWENNGRYWEWKIVRDVEYCYTWREENELAIHVTECSKTTKEFTLNLPIKDFAYAVAKCATEVIKREGFWGYYTFAEQCEDFDIRQFLYVKAFALDISEGMGYTAHVFGASNIRDELELLLFDM